MISLYFDKTNILLSCQAVWCW